MRITNKNGLPQSIVDAVKNDDYTKAGSDYSISELLAPPQMTYLRRKHDHEIIEDASERIWSLFGKAVHKVAEMASTEGVVERRLFTDVLGVKVSGAIDYYCPKSKTISDYKTCSVYKLKNGDYSEWEQQQNMYALLSRLNGIEVDKIEIVAFARDWRPSEKKRDPEYPSQSLVIPLPLWPQAKALNFLQERVALHEDAKSQPPECTPEERWAKPSVWAIKKRGGAKAIPGGLFADENFAKAKLAELGAGYYIEYRAGEFTRCSYCPVADFCEQNKRTQGVSDGDKKTGTGE